MGTSLAQQVAALPDAQREAVLADLDPAALVHDWPFWARPEQLAPPGDWNVWAIIAGRGAGKALDSTTPIPTPDGFTPIGELQPGDAVFDHHGTQTKVLSVHPQGFRRCYLVAFDDNTSLVADASHLWTYIPASHTVRRDQQPRHWWRELHAVTATTLDLQIGDQIPLAERTRTRRVRSVASVTQVGLRDATCITVAASSGLFLAGEGCITTHNTRSGAEWVRQKVTANPGCRIGLVGRAAPDVSKTMLYGESGIMGVFPETERPVHKISRSRLEFPNGSIAETFSAEEPSQLRGPAFHYAWADEPAAWQATKDSSGLNAWDNLRIATREGRAPQIVATTTPKRTAFMNDLLDEQADKPHVVVLSRGSTYDNAGNLSPIYLENITGVYAGTALARQELDGLMLDDTEGALWSPEVIERYRLWSPTPPATPLRVVAVDPSVAERPRDECGIIVVGATAHRRLDQRHAVVLEDASLLAAPQVWAREAVRVARKWRAPIVAEINQGGALVTAILQAAAPEIPVHTVRAAVGKRARAEPVTLPYQQGRVHHWGQLVELEDQQTTWDPEVVKISPDRLDALVWGLTALLIAPPPALAGGRIRPVRTTGRRLPTGAAYGRARLGAQR